MASCCGRVAVAGALVSGVLTVGPVAQTPPARKPAPKVEAVAVTVHKPSAPVEGRDNYMAYCAVCHGPNGKGDGPAAPAMKAPVSDLTTIARRHDGKFDAIGVERIISGKDKIPTPAHGVEDMPIWGDVFKNSDQAVTTTRIRNLVKYVESLQASAGR